MRWWVFTQDDIECALKAYVERKTSEQPDCRQDFQRFESLMRDFLLSAEARCQRGLE